MIVVAAAQYELVVEGQDCGDACLVDSPVLPELGGFVVVIDRTALQYHVIATREHIGSTVIKNGECKHPCLETVLLDVSHSYHRVLAP